MDKPTDGKNETGSAPASRDLFWIIGACAAIAFFALIIWFPLVGFPLLVFWEFAFGIYLYIDYRKTYTPGQNWTAIVCIAVGVASILDVIIRITLPNFWTIYHPIERIGGWVLMAMIAYQLFIQPWLVKKKKKWKELTNAELLNGYVWSAHCFGKDINSEEDKTTEVDREFRNASGAYLMLKDRGKERNLEPLLRHKAPAIRAMAARHLYWINKERSLKIMDEVGARNDGLGETMRIWAEACRKGEILPDPAVEH